MGPLVHLTNRNRFTACPSVRRSVRPSVRRGFRAFAGECMEGLAWNFTCRWIFTIFRTDYFMAMVCWFVEFWHYFDLVKRVKLGVSGHFPENAWGNGLKFCTLMYLDHLQNWSAYGYSLLIFLILVPFWLSETGQIWGFPGISRRTHGGNGLKLCMLIYLEHLLNWSVYGYGLLIFLILALFWLSETGQIWGFRAFPGERMEEMAWNCACWCILTTFRTDEIMVKICKFF